MAKDYFQDIMPRDSETRPPRKRDAPIIEEPIMEPAVEPVHVPERSIRNINVVRSRPQDRREVPPVGNGLPQRRRGASYAIIWILILLTAIGAGIFSVLLYRSTTVTIVPRAQIIAFDTGKIFTAYPVASAATGTLTYTVQTLDDVDSVVVASQGLSHTERKASGTVTLVNEYSAEPVRLIKTTRFSTPDGLIFRAPVDLSIPGMKGKVPGTVNVTLVADQAGDKYNIPPTATFSLPGLKGSTMDKKVYARSTSNFSGGFSGDEPAVSADVLSAAHAEIRAKLQSKVQTALKSAADTSTVFGDLATITYTDMPPAQEDSNHVRLHEKIHVEVPVVKTIAFNRLVASAASADAETADITLVPKQGFSIKATSATSTALGISPVSFSLSGAAQLVWNVDTKALAVELAGKDQSAFQTVVTGFQGIQNAKARIEPFWKKRFPSDPADIRIVVSEPAEKQ